MNLGDLLEELREGILHDFSDQVAGTSDELWSDKRLVRYIDEAQKKMAREALMIRDRTEVETVAFENEYPLDDSVIAVLSARCKGDLADLARAGHAAFDTYHVPDTYFFDPSSLSSLPPGKILAYDTDEFVHPDAEGSMGTVNLRLYPPPDSLHAVPVHLRVIRMPADLCYDDLTAIPEIPREHHIDMLDWAAYLALRIVDLDQGSPERAAEFKASFEVHVAEARKIAMRKMFTPSQWGFGRNGFSWETN